MAPAVEGAPDPGMPAIEIALSGDARVRIAASDSAGAGGRGRAGAGAAMIPVPTGVRVWLATGRTDLRRGLDGLALQDIFAFRGRRGNLIKILWHDGPGACLFAKRLERGRFLWPSPAEGGGDDHAGAARLLARRDRLAQSGADLAAAGCRLTGRFHFTHEKGSPKRADL